MNLLIDIEGFHGPFELLFELIEKDQIDIYNIPIHQITTDFIAAMDERDIPPEQIADFILFASILLEIKSQMLLPDASLEPIGLEDESDPRHQLLVRLLEYRKVREVDAFLTRREQRYLYHVFNDDSLIGLPEVDEGELEIEVDLLAQAFRRFLDKLDRFQDTGRPFFKGLRRENFSVTHYRKKIIERLNTHGMVTFEDLFLPAAPRGEWIATFLALLKLQQDQYIRLEQTDTFSPLEIRKRLA